MSENPVDPVHDDHDAPQHQADDGQGQDQHADQDSEPPTATGQAPDSLEEEAQSGSHPDPEPGGS